MKIFLFLSEVSNKIIAHKTPEMFSPTCNQSHVFKNLAAGAPKENRAPRGFLKSHFARF